MSVLGALVTGFAIMLWMLLAMMAGGACSSHDEFTSNCGLAGLLVWMALTLSAIFYVFGNAA